MILVMRFLGITAFLLITGFSFAQHQQFVSPLAIPAAFSGTFGEIRADHFHSGVDLRTKGQVGYNVRAVEKGFVSRIKVSPVGFGKTIYIDHPNGKTTVYAHLSEFSGKIADYVERAHYQKQSFDIELFPKPDELPVSKGDVIGLSGNSGSSGGPHLHFEVRETISQQIIDPFEHFSSWKQTDNEPPTINRLLVFEIDSANYLQSNLTYKAYSLVKKGNSFTLTTPVYVAGRIGFALDYYDNVNQNSFKSGIKKAEVRVNELETFTFQVDTFSFSETRYANGFNGISDESWNGYKAIRLWVDPNNKFSGIKFAINRGIIDLVKDSTYTIGITVWDHSSNSSRLTFTVIGIEKKPSITQLPDLPYFKWYEENSLETENYKVTLPKNSLFHDILFQMTETNMASLPYPIVNIHNPKTKLFKKIYIEYNMKDIPQKMLDKTYIAKVNGNSNEYVGGEIQNTTLKATCSSFGKYTVLVDTISPSITALNLTPKAEIAQQAHLLFKVTDNTSIKTYNGYIDGIWVLFEWDPKTALLSHKLSPVRTKQGSWHSLTIVVTDMLNNRSEYNTKFYW